MDASALHELLTAVAAGAVAPEDAARQLSRLPFADLGFALVDHHRALRQGLPEAIYGPGKTPEQCAAIVGELLEHGVGPVLLTRASAEQLAACPPGMTVGHTAVWRPDSPRPEAVALITAGTADTPVADECGAVLEAFGVTPRRIDDVGVAGLHRLLARLEDLLGITAVVVVAGMEGALASVIAGLVAVPVIAVPTSVGYGAGLGGVTALLAMLASCSPGVTVVGIDNGYGAACGVLRLLGPRAPAGLPE